jgi:hypothetical protein
MQEKLCAESRDETVNSLLTTPGVLKQLRTGFSKFNFTNLNICTITIDRVPLLNRAASNARVQSALRTSLEYVN